MPPREREKKRDPGSPAKEETPDQFIENRLVKLETGMTNLEAGVSDMAVRQSTTDAKLDEMAVRQSTTGAKLDEIIALMAGRQSTAAGGLGATAPSGGLGSEVQPEVISNLSHQFETPRPSGMPPLDPMASMSAVRVNTSGMDGKRRGTTRRY